MLAKIVPEMELERRREQRRARSRASCGSCRGRRRARVRVSGLDGECSCASAKCCQPLPGERIAGFITRGRGVTVHAADCPKVAGDRSAAPRRRRVAGRARASPRAGADRGHLRRRARPARRDVEGDQLGGRQHRARAGASDRRPQGAEHVRADGRKPGRAQHRSMKNLGRRARRDARHAGADVRRADRQPRRAPKPIGPYSQAIDTGTARLLRRADRARSADGEARRRRHQRGSGARDPQPDGRAGRGGIEAADVVKTTLFLVDFERRTGGWRDLLPRSSCLRTPRARRVQVAAPPAGARVELEAIAVRR